jgi:fermentation-respiration switch protein FrsA (DUF1100 family)
MNRSFITLALSMALACSSPETTEKPLGQSPPEATITQDVIYGHKLGMALTFDVYQPEVPNGSGVVLMNSGRYKSPRCIFHTGEDETLRLLTDAELDVADPICRELGPRTLVDDGFTVFNVRHSSAPRFVLPEVVSDVRRAVRFIRSTASDYGVDPNRLGLWGASAGGHLSLLLGTASEIGNSGTDDPLELSDGSVAAIVAYFPPTRFCQMPAENRARNPALDVPLDQLEELSPLHYATADDPPTLILHGDQDLGVPLEHGSQMYEALVSVGVESEFIVVEGAGHGFFGEDADFALAKTLDWFRRQLLR